MLSESLAKAGITPKDWDKRLRLLPNITDQTPCYRISIDKSGKIGSIDILSEDLAKQLRKWEPSNGMSFPGFNIQPLFRILLNEEERKLLRKWRDKKCTEQVDVDTLKEWSKKESTTTWNVNQLGKLEKCLNKTPVSLKEQLNEIPGRFKSLKNLFNRVLLFKEGKHENATVSLFDSIADYLFGKLTNNELGREFFPLLIYEGNPQKTPEFDSGSVSVYLDVNDWDEYPVASSETIDWINHMLISRNFGNENDEIALDAFGGTLEGDDEKMPSVKLEIVAEVKLRAMNSESNCQTRYKTIDASSFPIGKTSRKIIKGALEWLGDPSRNGETWGQVTSKELLFAYPSVLLKESAMLAGCFGVRRNDNEVNVARFSNLAKDTVQILKGSAPSLKEIEINLFSLRKMDKARTKVVYYRTYTAQRLFDAVQEWEDGCKNIPEIRIKGWGEKKGEFKLLEPGMPFPLQIAFCLQRVWLLDGKTECDVPVVSNTVGIDLLLDPGSRRLVPHLLSIALRNANGLFVSLGNSINKNEAIDVKSYNAHKLLMPSILGILLFKLNITKTMYMNQTPFLVGRMLKIADELHALYCKEIRKKQLPPQLIGNALMSAALDSPTQALAQMGQRILPYLAWAKTNNTESVGLARYFLKKFDETAILIASLDFSKRLDDTGKAQLFLGYLANLNDKETIEETKL